MTRTEAIALITARLASLDDDRLQTVADIVQDYASTTLQRPLSDREKSLLDQSRDDFAAGRTMTMDQLIDDLDKELGPLGVPRYRA